MGRKKKKDEDEQNYVFFKGAVLFKWTSGDSFVLVGTQLQNIERLKSSDLDKLIQTMKDREKEYEE